MKKLSPDDIEFIKTNRPAVSIKELAEKFNVNPSRISQIAPQSKRKTLEVSAPQEPAEASESVMEAS